MLRAQAGNRQALGQVLDNCQAPLLRHIARFVGVDDAVGDVWQETVIAAMKGLRSLKDPASFRPWLYRIATFKCRDWQRGRYRERASMRQLHELSHEDGLRNGSSEEQSVVQTLQTLDGEQRQILALYYREGLSIHELALVLATTPGAVKTRLFRARKQFRKHWEGEHHEQD